MEETGFDKPRGKPEKKVPNNKEVYKTVRDNALRRGDSKTAIMSQKGLDNLTKKENSQS